ncbi:hypothetical protein GCM10022240_25910 [Microbacterium kribbense]|uniref:Uncharacterized protein n=1 Tax=Microbacterium kribbense TaxID=433645 RepID=A0ABP7GR23_9MICO
MNTLLHTERTHPPERLHELTALTTDTRTSLPDRLTLRLGLWLLLTAARHAELRDRRRDDHEAHARRTLARETYLRAEREAAITRAHLTIHYR